MWSLLSFSWPKVMSGLLLNLIFLLLSIIPDLLSNAVSGGRFVQRTTSRT